MEIKGEWAISERDFKIINTSSTYILCGCYKKKILIHVVDPVSLEKPAFWQKKNPTGYTNMCTVYYLQSIRIVQLTADSAGSNSVEVTVPNEY